MLLGKRSLSAEELPTTNTYYFFLIVLFSLWRGEMSRSKSPWQLVPPPLLPGPGPIFYIQGHDPLMEMQPSYCGQKSQASKFLTTLHSWEFMLSCCSCVVLVI